MLDSDTKPWTNDAKCSCMTRWLPFHPLVEGGLRRLERVVVEIVITALVPRTLASVGPASARAKYMGMVFFSDPNPAFYLVL